MDENALSHLIINRAIKVHSALGPGLLESAYKQCLYYELRQAGVAVEMERPLPLVYEEVHLECGYRVDLLISGKVIIEVKACDALAPVHTAQVLTYLKLSDCKLGLLMNFNVALMKDGIKRVVRNLQ
ncbi:MAG: hypothetical protein UZ17_ACD001000110 [Acidobacteria bacterium OLB17]|nr:MAG: hypothetical protein UZ17_ACD001000110 [Acidobacteria bacterium OLB17]MCZ2390303.1 GxxExxY protein [Acidobacteriota bacterium]